jgi:hypothetical protein
VAGHPGVAVQRGQQAEAGLGAADLGQGDRAVERDHWVGRDAFEDLVQRVQLPPVGVLGPRGLGMDRGDGRLELVRAQG